MRRHGNAIRVEPVGVHDQLWTDFGGLASGVEGMAQFSLRRRSSRGFI